MTGVFWIDWAALAFSLTNTILLIWLGTTVLINVEERTWGGWLAAAGLYFGGIFFISHTAILGYGLQVVSVGASLWWSTGLLAVTILPLLWYVMMLWYSGYWQKGKEGKINSLAKRHRIWLLGSLFVLVAVLAVGMMIEPRSYQEGYPTRGINESPMVGGVPVMLVIFPLYLVMCMLLSLDAVRHPGQADDMLGELVRRRARPWLIAASVMLLVISLTVVGVFTWLFQLIGQPVLNSDQLTVIGILDVVIEMLITGAVILVGQAVVAYEIFTGQSLPRKGFIRQWHYAVLVGLGFGAVIGFVFSTNLRPIYGILLSSLLMTFFLAMFSWQTISERQRTIRSLRPFVTSERMYDQVVGSEEEGELVSGLSAPFGALCKNVLDTRQAYLLALGPMSPLSGEPLKYSLGTVTEVSEELVEQLRYATKEAAKGFTVEEQITRIELAVDPEIEWAVPMWSQRGLVGVLLLGGKQDESLYSREEIDVAQSSGERLIDSRVSAEVTRRLLGLQRQRLTETQVLDQRVRRVLHDDVLQDLHAAILKLAGSDQDEITGEAIEMMIHVHGEISRLIRNLPSTSVPDLKAMGLIGSLQRLVQDEIGASFDEVQWELSDEVSEAEGNLTELEQEVLYYAAREAMRNAVRHGRVVGDENRPFCLKISVSGIDGIMIIIEDDGAGFEGNALNQATSKQGLPLHATMLAVIGGELRVESELDRFTRIMLILRN